MSISGVIRKHSRILRIWRTNGACRVVNVMPKHPRGSKVFAKLFSKSVPAVRHKQNPIFKNKNSATAEKFGGTNGIYTNDAPVP